MSMGGGGPEVLTTLTTDMGKILDGIHRTKIKGTSHFSTGINIAAVRQDFLKLLYSSSLF
jgi:26S proteasome regulatory subunit N10